MRRTMQIPVLLAVVSPGWRAACAENDHNGGASEAAPRTLTTDEMALMCRELCQEASYCGRLEDVGGTACEAECAEALLAQDYDTVAVWSCMDWAGAPYRCDELEACLDGVPTNASCTRGCAALDACGAYPYFGNMDLTNEEGHEVAAFRLHEMPPIEAVCSRWCDGQVAFGANAELEGKFACYASALEGACDAFELFACGDYEVADCETACASVDACRGEAPGAFGSSAACEAHCDRLDGGARRLFARCVGRDGDCDPAVDPGCGVDCVDTTECEVLPREPSRGCLRACDAAVALCDPGDQIGTQLCAWTCAEEELEVPGLGDRLAPCTERQSECVTRPSFDTEGRWGGTMLYCYRDPSEDCRSLCVHRVRCDTPVLLPEDEVDAYRRQCELNCASETEGEIAAQVTYLETLDPESPTYCDRVRSTTATRSESSPEWCDGWRECAD